MSEATFTLPMPPSVNRIWRSAGKHVYRSREYLAWINAAGLSINAQRVPEIEPPYSVEYAFGRKDNRRTDLLNREKALSDLLQSAGVITDDCKINAAFIYWCPKQDAGTVKVTVRTI